ncbi:MAG: YihY/virulence factor BrkB family protein [Chitinophagaceae bacterium]
MSKRPGLIARVKTIFSFLKDVISNFSDDKVLKYSASLSYYTVFSIAPILIIIISIAGIFFGRDAVQHQIAGQISGMVGDEAATQIQSMIGNTHKSGNNVFAGIVSTVILVIGATSIFGEIQDSINSIWGLKSKPKKGLIKMVINRLISFSLIISLGFIAMVSLVLDLAVKILSDYMGRIPGAGVYFVETLNYILNFVVISFMFSVIFKVLPDAKIKWGDVIKGAIVTAILFIIGREVISFYVAKNNFTTVYGAAASIVIILVWVYYTAVILYFGAEFTKVYALNYGSKILPNDYAVWIKVKEEELPRQALDEVKKDEQLEPAINT